MQKKLTITIDEDIYDALYRVIGPRKIGKFIEKSIGPLLIQRAMEQSYAAQAAEEEADDFLEDWSWIRVQSDTIESHVAEPRNEES